MAGWKDGKRVAPARKRATRLNPVQRRQVKALIKAPMEHKFFDSNTSAVGVPLTAILFQISVIPQGDTDITRDGDQLMLTSIDVRGMVNVADTTNLVRLIFFQWRPNSNPALTDILNTGVNGIVPDVYSMYNHDQKGQFKVLYDKTFKLAGFGTSASPSGAVSQEIFKLTLAKKLIKKLQYINGTTAGMNQVWYLAISDSTVSSDPTLTMKVRFNFIDA